ncbi:MAG: 50S ribosome-binding GTPase, partial [Chloroflexia bacterium]|nr:50S ribosome-binding GTPase [Chloroflexia bacterium]
MVGDTLGSEPPRGAALSRRAGDQGAVYFVATTLVIMGLPGAGKTTVFNALTRAEAATGTYAAADEPNLATVKVPD